MLLFSAILFKSFLCPYDEKLSKLETRLLVLVTLIILLLKPGYVLFLPLQLLIPASRFESKKIAYLCKFIPLTIAGLLFIWWSHIIAGPLSKEALIRPGPGWNLVIPSRQTIFILLHPLTYAAVLVKTSFVHGYQYILGMIADLGFQHVRLPGIGYVAEIITLLIALVVSEGVKVKKIVPISLFVITVITVLIIATSFYITYTNVASSTLIGIQGRYFVSLLPFVVWGSRLIIGNRLTFIDSKKLYRLAPIILCLLVVLSLSLVTIKFQMITWG